MSFSSSSVPHHPHPHPHPPPHHPSSSSQSSLPSPLFSTLSVSSIKSAFKNNKSAESIHKHLTTQNKGKGEAGVLVGLFSLSGVYHVLLTSRPLGMRTHSGETALPGGKRDDTDTDITFTARREANEEIGLPLSSSFSDPLCTLHPYLAKHGSLVTPTVQIIQTPIQIRNIHIHNTSKHTQNNDDYEDTETTYGQFMIKPNPAEVSCTFAVPLEMFLYDKYHYSKDIHWQSGPYVLHYFDYSTNLYLSTPPSPLPHSSSSFPPTPAVRSFHIWGLTAAICIHAAVLAFNRQPQFKIHVSAPKQEHREQLQQQHAKRTDSETTTTNSLTPSDAESDSRKSKL